MKEINIIISGVGGQGNVLLERVIGMSAIKEGYPVRAADTFGASQRGGSVLSHLRLGSEVRSSLIPQGRSHIILGLEPGEALGAAIKFLSTNGLIIVNMYPTLPAKVKVGEWIYPSAEKISKLLSKLTPNMIKLDATALARQVTGSERPMNLLMAGVLIALDVIPISVGTVKKVIEQMAGSFAQESILAFETGFKFGREKQTTQQLDISFA